MLIYTRVKEVILFVLLFAPRSDEKGRIGVGYTPGPHLVPISDMSSANSPSLGPDGINSPDNQIQRGFTPKLKIFRDQQKCIYVSLVSPILHRYCGRLQRRPGGYSQDYR